MNELALFAGAGGGILGGLLHGWRTVAAVEIEDYPRRVLLQRQADGILPRFPIWDDVCTFDGKPWRGKVDVVTGGFPCQDISAAGKGAGIGGARSGLWSEMARIIGEVRPRYVFVENSPLLVGRGLAVVLGDLAEMGYDARWGVLGAHHVGAPHKRNRIWILATLADSAEGHAGQPIVGAGDDGNRPDRASQRRELCYQPSRRGEAVAHANVQRLAQREGERSDDGSQLETVERVRVQWWDEDPADMADAAGRDSSGSHGVQPQQVESRRGGGSICAGWRNAEPPMGRVANGVASRVDRLKALGNGQVSAVAAVAWTLLMELRREG